MPNQLGRMVYLSAVTITTVGFGDIVPLTSAASGAVAAEAVLGIMIAGLFVNSVFPRREWSGRASGPSQ